MFDLTAGYLLLQIVLAFFLCFFGYRHIRTLLSIYAFLAGFFGAYFLLLPLPLSVLLRNILCILAGLLCSGLTYALYRLAMFAAGAGLGLAVGLILCHSFGIPPFGTVGLVLLGALPLAAGALSIGYKRILLVLSTACCGALLLSLHGGYFIGYFSKIGFTVFTLHQPLRHTLSGLSDFFAGAFPYLLGASLLLSLAGVLLQFHKSGRKK